MKLSYSALLVACLLSLVFAAESTLHMILAHGEDHAHDRDDHDHGKEVHGADHGDDHGHPREFSDTDAYYGNEAEVETPEPAEPPVHEQHDHDANAPSHDH